MASTTALIAGHTGLVGRHLLAGLLQGLRYARVKAVGRRAPALTHSNLEPIITELGALASIGTRLAADDVFCCLGTTLRQAGSRAAFEQVDYHMVVDLARAAHAAGAQRFFLVSSLSASARSRIFYSRVKGRAEDAVSAVGYTSVHILRPSLLLGEHTDPRPGEAIAQKLLPLFSPLLRGPLAIYRPVTGAEVAAALLQLAEDDQAGVTVSTLPLRR